MKRVRLSKRAENLCRLATGEGTTEEERRTAAVQLAKLIAKALDKLDQKELEEETAQKETESRARNGRDWWDQGASSSARCGDPNYGPYNVSADGSEWSFGGTRVKIHPPSR